MTDYKPTTLETAYRACTKARGSKFAKNLVATIGKAEFLHDVSAANEPALLKALRDGAAGRAEAGATSGSFASALNVPPGGGAVATSLDQEAIMDRWNSAGKRRSQDDE